MPRKKSVKRCAEQFGDDANALLQFCLDAEATSLSDAQVTLAYDAAIIKLYAAFEKMVIGALTGAINNDTSVLSGTTHVQFPKHLTDEVCEYIIIGNGYFNFRGRDGLIGEIKKYVPDAHYLVAAVKKTSFRRSLDQLCALRNFAAHNSGVAKQAALKAIGQQKVSTAGAWLKRQNRFKSIVDDLIKLADEVEQSAPY